MSIKWPVGPRFLLLHLAEIHLPTAMVAAAVCQGKSIDINLHPPPVFGFCLKSPAVFSCCSCSIFSRHRIHNKSDKWCRLWHFFWQLKMAVVEQHYHNHFSASCSCFLKAPKGEFSLNVLSRSNFKLEAESSRIRKLLNYKGTPN